MSRFGLITFATDTGLGIQTRSLFEHLHPTKVMLVDLNAYNHMPVHREWYDSSSSLQYVTGFPTHADVDRFLDGLDTVMCCETPLNYLLFSRAAELGIKTVLQANPEFCDYLNQFPPARPTVIGLPSPWMRSDIERVAGTAQVIDLPAPIALDELHEHTAPQARTFVHVAGRPAHGDRNGTLDFIAAAQVAAPAAPEARFVVYCQQPTPEIHRAITGTGVELRGAVERPADIYQDADVLVLPRRYGGLCLPQQEAIGCGIPVLMPDISPNNHWLPLDWLIPVQSHTEVFMARSPITMYRANVQSLAMRMVWMYRDAEQFQKMRGQARELAQTRSWDALLPLYREVLRLDEVAA